MIYLVCISLDERVEILHVLWSEMHDYVFLPDKDGGPVYFNEHKHAVEWVEDNILPHKIKYESNECDQVDKIRSEYMI